MATPFDELYVACCPFCDYRQVFPSESQLLADYGRHLHQHEVALECRSGRGRGPGVSEARIAAHVRRIRAAPFN